MTLTCATDNSRHGGNELPVLREAQASEARAARISNSWICTSVHPPTVEALGNQLDMLRPNAAAAANDLHAASDPGLGGGDEGRGRQVPEAPVGVLPFAAIRIASHRPAPGTEHGVERAVCRLYGAVHDGNGRALAGRKHGRHARLEWPLNISPAEKNRPTILAEKAGEPNPNRKTRGDSRFDDDLALIDVPDHLEHQQIGPGLGEQLRLLAIVRAFGFPGRPLVVVARGHETRDRAGNPHRTIGSDAVASFSASSTEWRLSSATRSPSPAAASTCLDVPKLFVIRISAPARR